MQLSRYRLCTVGLPRMSEIVRVSDEELANQMQVMEQVLERGAPLFRLLAAGDKQAAYEAARKLRREQWAQSDEEDWCARKEVEPGTYKPLHD